MNITSPTVTFDLGLPGGQPLHLIVSPRARRMRLRVDPRTGSVQLTVPKRVSQRRAVEWAAGQRGWIEAALAEVPPRSPIAPGSSVPVEGIARIVDWSAERPRRVVLEEQRIITGGPLEGLERRILRWLAARARETLDRETREMAAKAGRAVVRISVGDPHSRWGSCSSSGSIRYSWRLIMAPDWVRRATVAHEVAHLVHMNHAPAFHALVAELFGDDPAPARRWLRREGAGLHRVGRTG